MTYLQFHVTWMLPALLVAALFGLPAVRSFGQRGWLALLATPLLALLYTTPWDNYLVFREVWGYPPERVFARIGYVPVEEYLFFILQPLLTGLLCIASVRCWLAAGKRADTVEAGRLRAIGAAVGVALILLGVAALRLDRGLYLGLILVWAVPVLLGMWLYRASHIWALRWPAGAAFGAATLYLWVADRYAIDVGIWWISPTWSSGWEWLGLPMEEAVFFAVTNLLVVFGTILFLDPLAASAGVRDSSLR